MYRYQEAFSAFADRLRLFIHSLKGLVVMFELEKPERLLLGEMMMIYAAAKLLEQTEAAVFALTAEVISGQSLKQAGASFAAWPVITALMDIRKIRGKSGSTDFAAQ